jgi:hypothetical protein
MVPLTDFLVGVLSAMVLYGVLYRFLDEPPAVKPRLTDEPTPAGKHAVATHSDAPQRHQRQAS